MGGLRAAHEWIGIVFAFAGLIHLATHKKAFSRYFHTGYSLLTAGVILAGGFIYGVSFTDIYASAAAFERLSKTEMNTLAAVLEHEPGFIADQLRAMELTVDHESMSMVEIADKNQIDIHDIMDILFRDAMR